MKTGTTVAIVAGALAVLGVGGAAVYFATRDKPGQKAGNDDVLARTQQLEYQAQIAQAQANAAKAQADALKAQAEAAEKPFLEELFLEVVDDFGDFAKTGFGGAVKI